MARFSGSWRPDELRNRSRRSASPGWRLHRQNPQGCEANRFASSAAGKGPVHHQPQDRESAGPQRPQHADRTRRRGDRVKRREFITLLGGAVATWPLVARAQQAASTVRQVGLIASAPPTPAMLNAFRDGMRERGYIGGQNQSVAVRWPQGSFDQDPSVVTELVNSNVDVIVAWASPAVIAVRRATSTIPIVMVSVGDPVGSGFIASLARPGGNITGLSNITVDLSAKLMELFAELVPGMKRVGVVGNPNNPAMTVLLRKTEDAVRKLNMQAEIVDAQTSDEFERAFAHIRAKSVDGVAVLADSPVIEHSRRLPDLAQSQTLP